MPAGQGELFATWRHHDVFTDSPEPMLAGEATHRRHAVIEQVIADLRGLAHLPSGSFAATSALLVLAVMAFNPTRGAAARTAHRLRLHLPRDWPWRTAWTELFDATRGPPTAPVA